MNTPDEKRQPPAVAEVFHGDEIDETFDGRLRQALVRHFRFEWRELKALRARFLGDRSTGTRDTSSAGESAASVEGSGGSEGTGGSAPAAGP